MAELSMELESNLDYPEHATKQPRAVAPGKVRIILDENDDIPPTGQFFGLNGVSYMIQPGVEVDVPPGIIDILDAAVVTVPVINSLTKQTMGYRHRRRYSYSRV